MARVYKRYGISTAMRPHTTIRNLWVHPKDKVSKEDTAECVYRVVGAPLEAAVCVRLSLVVFA